MRKLFLLIASACLLVPAAYAQEVVRTEDENTVTIVEETKTPEGRVVTTTTIDKKEVFTNGFWHNWELVLGLGTQMYFGENDRRVKDWYENLAFPSIDLYLTKWASPTFGVGIGANVSQFKGLYQGRYPDRYKITFADRDDKRYNKADSKYDYYQLTKQKGYYGNVFALAHVDLGNLFFGYKPKRFYTIDAYAGGGVIFGIDDEAWGASFNAGFMNKFRLSDLVSLQLNLRGALVSDDFDGETHSMEPDEKHYDKNHKIDGLFGATVGLAFKLGKEHSTWRNASRSSTVYYNDNLKPEVITETKIEKVVEKVIETPDLWFHINFVIDKWEILKREHINLESVADIMKSTPNTKYLLVGYADKQTATPSHNLMLSENRVKAVYDVLVNELGVPASQLVTDYKGGVDYMFYNEKEFSRCVMISTIKE